MFKVLVSDPISDLGIQQLVDAQDVAVDKKPGLSEDELVSIIGEYDALLVRPNARNTAYYGSWQTTESCRPCRRRRR